MLFSVIIKDAKTVHLLLYKELAGWAYQHVQSQVHVVLVNSKLRQRGIYAGATFHFFITN